MHMSVQTRKRLFTRDKYLYKTFFSLLWVMALQQLATFMVNMVDNLMLGRYTELALNGATLVNQFQFVLLQLAGGCGMGVIVLGSQYWGKRDVAPIRRVASIGIKFSFLTGLIFFAIAKLFPVFILRLFTNDEAVIAEGVRYLDILAYTFLIFPVSNTLMQILRSVETAFIGTVMSVSTVIINLCLNYCLIYGNLGFPEMGIQGAAIATLFSRVVELLIILVYVLRIDKKLKLQLKHIFGFDFGYLRDFAKTAVPLMASGALWGVATGVQTAIMGHMSSTVIAANSITLVIFQIFVVVGFASTQASSVTMGKTVGAGQFDKVREYSRTLQFIFLGIGLVAGSCIFFLREAIVSLYAISPEAKEMALDFLIVMSITTIGTCYEYPVQSGIIAGGGRPGYQAVVDNLFMWLFTIPASALCAFVFKTPPVVVFLCTKADQVLKCLPNGIVCNRYKWIRRLTREEEEN